MSLSDWLPDDGAASLFGTRRVYEMILPSGKKLIGDPFVADWRKRTWRERLFSRPWRPFVKTVRAPTAFVVDGNVLVSIKTFLEFEGKYGSR